MAGDYQTFSDVLNNAMTDFGITGNRELGRYLEECGLEGITGKRISEYRNGTVVPPFEKADGILKRLNAGCGVEVLEEMLAYSRVRAREYKDMIYSGKTVLRGATLNLRELLPGHTAEETRQMLDQRVEELCGDRSHFSAYVSKLISKDLNEYIIGETEET